MRDVGRLARDGFAAARRRLRGLRRTATVDRPFQYATAPDFFERLAFLERSQHWSAERFHAHALERRRVTVLRAFERVPLYAERFRAAGCERGDLERPESFDALPCLDKRDLQLEAERLFDPGVSRDDCEHVTTGGSTGRQVGLWHHREVGFWEEAFVWRHWRWFGVAFDDRAAICRGVRPATGAIGQHPLLGLVLSGFDLGWQSAPDYLRALACHGPAFLRGYPFTLDLLARRALALGEPPLRGLKAVFTSSELLAPDQRERIARAFAAPVVDLYGHAERAVAAGECAQGSLHVFPEYGYLEIVDERGRPLPAGSPGEIAATSFHNPAMPLVRYRTGDRGRLSAAPCSCGRQMPVLLLEGGRLQDCVVTPEGRLVSAAAINDHSELLRGIELFRLVQHDPAMVTFEFVPLPDAPAVDAGELEAGLRRKLGSQIAIRIERCAAIPRTPAGKHRFIVSTLDPASFESQRNAR
ncbi:MAG TPA: AMP-binding protein [Candidatus Polarisedimenticolaceae bacterium]|nr:AMP-binding protein [Candidatus Polarisedimenticolaceae bacterium]